MEPVKEEALMARISDLVASDPSAGYRQLHKKLKEDEKFQGVALKKVQTALQKVRSESAASSAAADAQALQAPGKLFAERIRHNPVFEKAITQMYQNLAKAGGGDEVALCLHVEDGELGEVRRLLDSRVAVDARTAQGLQAIHSAAVGGHCEVLAMLLEARADPNARQKQNDKVFPLGQAAAQGHVQIVEALLEHRANVNAFDARGRCALSPAALRGHDTCLTALLEARANPEGRTVGNVTEMSALAGAAVHGRVSSVRLLLEKAGADASARWCSVNFGAGQTPLHAAARGGFDRGYDRAKETAQGRAKVWTDLVAHGASPDVANDAGETAWDWASADRLFTQELQCLAAGGVAERGGGGAEVEDPSLVVVQDLPPALGPWRDVVDFSAEKDLVSAVVRGQAGDMAFLFKTMPAALRRDIREECRRGSPSASALRIVEAIHAAATGGQPELESPEALVSLCDAELAQLRSRDGQQRQKQKIAESAMFFLRGVVRMNMREWQAAGADFLAAYAASGGRAPWILRLAAYCRGVAAFEGVAASSWRVVVEHYEAAEAMYKDLLAFIEPLATAKTPELLMFLASSKWGWAQVLLWQADRLQHRGQTAPAGEVAEEAVAQGSSSLHTDSPWELVSRQRSEELLKQACSLTEGALAAETLGESLGSSLSRSSAATRDAVLDALKRLQAESAAQWAEALRGRRVGLDAGALQVAWAQAAEELRGRPAAAQAEHVSWERRQQAERFEAEEADLTARKEAQLRALRAQMEEVEARYQEDLESLQQGRRDQEAKLEAAFGGQSAGTEAISVSPEPRRRRESRATGAAATAAQQQQAYLPDGRVMREDEVDRVD